MKKKQIPFAIRFAASTLFAVLSVSTAVAQQPDDASAGKLKFVVIVSRHGVRSPTGKVDQLNQYSAQPWPKWDVPPGYLTSHGAELMKLFGAYDRSYYVKMGLFADTGCGDAKRVSFYSDSDERTVETGKALAAGMFPGCKIDEQSVQHSLPEGEADPLFHSLEAGVGKPDRNIAVASIGGRIGNDPGGLTQAYQAELEELQRVLLGCPRVASCPSPDHTAAKLLLNVTPSLDSGKDDHLAELKGPLNTASTMTENLLLEYADDKPMEQVGWGRVDLTTLKQLLDLHTAASDLTRRSSYLATVQASNILDHILKTMEQAVSGKTVIGALGNSGDKAVVLVGHDTNISSIAATLNMNWLVDGRRDDTPPGGAIVFELWQNANDSGYKVKAYYTAQTLEQMRSSASLSLKEPPAKANIFIPGCSRGDAGYSCEWKSFSQTVRAAIDPAFVK